MQSISRSSLYNILLELRKYKTSVIDAAMINIHTTWIQVTTLPKLLIKGGSWWWQQTLLLINFQLKTKQNETKLQHFVLKTLNRLIHVSVYGLPRGNSAVHRVFAVQQLRTQSRQVKWGWGPPSRQRLHPSLWRVYYREAALPTSDTKGSSLPCIHCPVNKIPVSEQQTDTIS